MLEIDELVSRYEIVDRARSHLRANFVASLDGAATIDGRSGGLGDAEDQRLLGVLRMLADVLLVGGGTVRAEGYGALRLEEEAVEWRRSQGLTDYPVLAVVTGSLALDPASEVLAQAPVRPLVITHVGAPAERRDALGEVADVVECGEDAVDANLVRAELERRGLPQILCEGGPSLFGSLVAADAVDELCLTLAPVLVGGTASRIATSATGAAHGMRLHHTLPGERMLFLRYQRDTP